MKVIIFDDIKAEAEALIEALDYAFDKLNLKAEYSIYHKLDCELDLSPYDLIFLDIEIGDQNGIEFGRKLREDNIEVPIILTTNFKQYAIEGYKIKADRYFLKPIDKFELYLELKELLKDNLRKAKYFYDDKISFDKIYFKDIYYVEVINRRSYLHTRLNGVLESNKPLREWIEIFDDYGFAQIHKAFLINLRNIKLLKNNQVTLNNNECLDITRHYRESFEEAYVKYIVKGY